ncbi:MAG: hypothetical protein NTW20_15675, partial [Rhodobacterales bacterium]|nr:hypothetical protein [Rhodobacterales bacterium]
MTPAIPALVFLICGASSVLAQGLQDRLFPTDSACYSRKYSSAHLASHPEQQVTSMALRPETRPVGADLELWVSVTLRTWPDEVLLALAYCTQTAPDRLDCGLEGDAGGFSISRAKDRAVLVSVSDQGMGFEGQAGFATLDHNRGDDRSF